MIYCCTAGGNARERAANSVLCSVTDILARARDEEPNMHEVWFAGRRNSCYIGFDARLTLTLFSPPANGRLYRVVLIRLDATHLLGSCGRYGVRRSAVGGGVVTPMEAVLVVAPGTVPQHQHPADGERSRHG